MRFYCQALGFHVPIHNAPNPVICTKVCGRICEARMEVEV